MYIGINEQVRRIINEFCIFAEDQIEQIKKMLPKEIPESIRGSTGTLVDGARQVRLLGRLCLYSHAKFVQNRIQTLLHEICQVNRINETKKLGYNVSPQFKKVFIVTSLGGGCGSGIFIDVAYILRDILVRNNWNFTVHGILVMPSAFAGLTAIRQPFVRANAYAALTELNHYMESAQFECYYAIDMYIKSSTKPFDYVHIVGGLDEQGELIT